MSLSRFVNILALVLMCACPFTALVLTSHGVAYVTTAGLVLIGLFAAAWLIWACYSYGVDRTTKVWSGSVLRITQDAYPVRAELFAESSFYDERNIFLREVTVSHNGGYLLLLRPVHHDSTCPRAVWIEGAVPSGKFLRFVAKTKVVEGRARKLLYPVAVEGGPRDELRAAS